MAALAAIGIDTSAFAQAAVPASTIDKPETA
jgi:hypothetical protein